MSTVDYLAAVSYVDRRDVIAYLDLYHPGSDPDDVSFDAATDTIDALGADGWRIWWLELDQGDEDLCRCAAGMGGREHRRGKGCT